MEQIVYGINRGNNKKMAGVQGGTAGISKTVKEKHGI
jgi:hypothetical protein